MKTREEFVLLAEAYRKEVSWRGWLTVLALLLAFFISVAPAMFITHFIGYRSAGGLIWIAFFLMTVVGINLYQSKSRESLARKFGLVCPNCSHVIMGLLDLKLATVTHNCPHCGDHVFS